MANPIMKYFNFEDEHPYLSDTRVAARLCHELAHDMDARLPDGPEKSAGLRKLLEAKDCFVRAAQP